MSEEQGSQDQTEQSPTEAVIDRFGGIRPMATKLGVTASTVQGWKTRGHIPAQRREELIVAARDNDIDLSEQLLDAAMGDSDDNANRQNEGAPVTTAASGSGSGGDPSGDRTDGPRAGRVGRAALTVALIALALVVLSPWWGGWVAGDAPTRAIDRLTGRIQALEVQVEGTPVEVQNLLTEVDALEIALDERAGVGQMQALSDRLDDLESAVASGVAGDVAAVSQRLTRVIEALDTQATAIEQLRAQVSSIGNRVSDQADALATRAGADALDAAVADLSARMDEVERLASQRSGAAAAMALAAGQMRQAINRGNGYADALAGLRRAVSQPGGALAGALETLSAHAETGVATRDRLADRLGVIAPQIRAAAEPPAEGWIDGALGAVGSLVTVRRAPGENDGSDADSIVARAEGRMQSGDLGGAVEALAALEGAPGEAAAIWLAQARDRLAVEAALGTVEAAVVDRLGTPPVDAVAPEDQAPQDQTPDGQDDEGSDN